MAKKKPLESDNWDIDDGLDFPDFNFDEAPPKDDRNPATKIASAAAEGFGNTLVSSDNIRSFVKGALPRGYGETLDLADHTAGSLRNLYNTTAKEIKPLVNDIKKTSARLVPLADRVLPKGLAEKFKKFTTIESKASYEQSLEDAKEASLQAELGAVFEAQAKETQEHRAEQETQGRLRDGMTFKRHRESTDILNQISQGTQELAAYQRSLGMNYQRKSLELQFRSFFVARDNLEEVKRHNATTTTALENIVKNTGLPEYVKLKNSERIGEAMRNRFIGAVGDSMGSLRKNFVRNFSERLTKSAQNKVREVSDGVRQGLGAVDSLAELQEMQSQFGPGRSGGETAGELGGGMVAGALTQRAAKWAREKTEGNENIVRKGNWLSDQIHQMPQRALKWANGYGGIGKGNIGAGSGWLDFIKDTIRGSLPGEDVQMEGDKLTDIRDPDVFNRRTNRSITDIIPGFLARIYRELKIMRTGDANQELVEYDFTSNKFLDSSSVKKNILNALVGSSDKRSARRESDDLVASLDAGNKLTPEQKQLLGKLMLKNNMKNGVGDSKDYSNENSEQYRGVNASDAEAFAEVFKTFFEDDKTGAKQSVFGRQFGKLGDGIADKKAMVQDFINANQKDHLVELGLIDEKTNQFDLDKFYDYLLEAESGANATPGRRSPSQTLGAIMGPNYRQNTQSRAGINGAAPTVSRVPHNGAPVSGGFSQYAPASELQDWSLYRDSQLEHQQMASNRWNTQARHSGMEQNYGNQDWSTYTNKRKNKGQVPLTTAPMAQYGFQGALGGLNAAPALPTVLRQVSSQPDQVPEETQTLVNDAAQQMVQNRLRQVAEALPTGQPTTRQERETRPEPEAPRYQTNNVTVDNSDVVRAIEEHSAKKPTETLAEIVLRIEQKLNDGITLNGINGEGGGRTGGSGNIMDRTLGDGIRGAKSMLGKGFGWMRDSVKKSNKRIMGMGNWAWDKVKAGTDMLVEKATEMNDVYIKGKLTPVLTKAKLLAGEYYVEGKEGAITTFKGITESIYDKDGNLVISKEDLQNAFQKTGIGRGIVSAFGAASRFVKRQFDRASKFVPASYRWAADLATKGLGSIQGFLDQPQDVYVSGKPNPVLTAVTMRGGGYKDRATGSPVTRVSEIKGPVVNDVGDTVLTDEDIAKGLLDKNGKKIVVGFKGLATKAGRALKWSFDKVVGGMKKAKDWTADKLGKIKDGIQMGDWGFSADISLGTRSKHTVTLLHQIRDMLNDRLPGERTTFAEIDFKDDVSSRAGKAMRKLRDKINEKRPGWSEKAESLKERLREKKESMQAKWAEKRGGGSVRDFLSNLLSGKPTSMFESAKDRAKGLRDKMREKYDAAAESVGERGERMAKLKEKKDALMERMAEKKEKAKEKALELKEKSADKLAAIHAKITEAREKAKAKDAEEEADDEGGLNLDFGDGGGNDEEGRKKGKKKKRRSKLSRRLGRSKLGRGMRRFGKSGAGRFLGGAGRAALGVGRAGLGLAMGSGGSALAGLAGAGSGMTGMLGGAAGMVGSGIAGLGSLAMGAGGMLVSGAAAIGSVISAPVVLGALAIAGLAYGGYKAYQYFTKHKLDTYSKMRYAQYGFAPQDEDHLQAVFGLEDSLKDAIVMKGEMASLDDSKIDTKKVLETFGVEIGDTAQINKFAEWFANRFKPVFLTNVAGVRMADGSKWLSDISDFTVEQKRKYLNIAKFPGGPYNVFTSPFADQKQLPSGPQEVASAVAMAEAQLQQEGEKDGKKGAAAAAAVAGVGAVGAVKALENAAAKDGTSPRVGLTKPEAVEPGKLAQLTAVTLGATDTAGRGMMLIGGPTLDGSMFDTGRLDAMTAIRYKTYGLKELETDKVRALSLTEAETYKRIKVDKGVAYFNGSVEQMLHAVGTAFGVVGSNNNTAYDWITWYNMRFLPAYLAYITAMCTATGKNDVKDAQTSITDLQAVEVATITYTAKSEFSGSSTSVWQVPISPWPGYTLNNDVTSTDGNMQGLKNKAKQSKVSEETSRADARGMEGGSAGAALAAAAAGATTPNRPQDKPGFFSNLWSGSDGKGGIAGAASGAWEGAKSAASSVYEGARDALGFGGGKAMNHPGGGTGGDINQIPMPKGNGTWDGVKDTIIGAARMVGMDEKMMASIAAIESGFNHSIKAKTSSATGLFQFIKDTWDGMIKKFGPKYGIDPSTPPTDPRANALMGAEYLKQNANVLKNVIKDRPLSDTDLYMAHFLGGGGASTFFKADPNAIAAQVLPKAAKANIPIFYQDGRPRTVAEVYALMNNKMRSRGKQFGIDDGSQAVVASAKPSAPSAAPAATGAKVVTATPGSTAGSTVPAAVSANMPAPEKNPTQNVPSPASKAVAPVAMTAAMSNIGVETPVTQAVQARRSNDVAAQQQVNRDMAAEQLNTTNKLLQDSLGVQQGILSATQDLVKLVKADVEGRAQARQKGALKEPVTPAASAPPRQDTARPMTAPPISMRKSTSY